MVKKFRGQALVEYGLILALIAVVAIAVLVVMSGALNGILSFIASKLSAA